MVLEQEAKIKITVDTKLAENKVKTLKVNVEDASKKIEEDKKKQKNVIEEHKKIDKETTTIQNIVTKQLNKVRNFAGTLTGIGETASLLITLAGAALATVSKRIEPTRVAEKIIEEGTKEITKKIDNIKNRIDTFEVSFKKIMSMAAFITGAMGKVPDSKTMLEMMGRVWDVNTKLRNKDDFHLREVTRKISGTLLEQYILGSNH